MQCVLTSIKLTTKKTELQVEPETLETKVELTKPQSPKPNLVLRLPTKEIMSRVHLKKMPEMFLDSVFKLRLELPSQSKEEVMTVTMNQLPEAEVAEEEEEEAQEVAMLAEMLEFKELMKKETLTLITEEAEVEEVVQKLLSTKDSIEETELEELPEVEEKEKTELRKTLMLEVMSQYSNKKKSKKFKQLSQWFNMKLSDNL